MAEALLRAQAGERPIQVMSAGSQPAEVDPDAVEAMAHFGIDITAQQSKHLDLFRNEPFDYVITVCDQVREECPVFPSEPNLIHWSIPDPAATVGTPGERRTVFIDTAHALAKRVEHFLVRLDAESAEVTF
jgi:protein-tyrosine-phosphatase